MTAAETPSEGRIVVNDTLTEPRFLARHVAELDSDSRAILDLSLRYGFSDERLAAMLQIGLDEVAVRREEALAALAESAGVDAPADRRRLEQHLLEVPHETWLGRELQDPGPEPAPAGADAGGIPAATPYAPETLRQRSSRHRPAAALVALAALIALVALIAWRGGDDASEPNAPLERVTVPPPPADAGPGSRVALEPIAGAAPSRATIRLLSAGPPATVAVSLHTPTAHPGIYEVWLYDTVIDAVSLAKIPHGGGTARFTLPESAADYRYIDVSEEKPGGFPGHSGRSVERIGVPAALAGLGLGGG